MEQRYIALSVLPHTLRLRGEGGEVAMFLLQLCPSEQTSNRVSTMLLLSLGNCQMKGWSYDFKLELP